MNTLTKPKPFRWQASRGLAVLLLAFATTSPAPAAAVAWPAGLSTTAGERGGLSMAAVAPSGEKTASLESAAKKAGDTGRKIAMSLIALGLAIASIVLVFRRDFKEAAGVFAVGLVAILLATPAGVNVLHDTVNALFGSS
jgi:hypothetical protein